MPMTRRLLLLGGLGSALNVGVILAVDRWQQRNWEAEGDPIGATAVSQAEVIIRGFQYWPAEVILKRGGTVIFTNTDSTPHTATPLEGAQFQGTGRLRRNESKAVVFEVAGVHTYFCDIHPSMVGRIVVVE